MTRFPLIRRKVMRTGSGTRWPGIYVDVSFDDGGCVHHLTISEPGKFSDTALAELLESIAVSVNEILDELRERRL